MQSALKTTCVALLLALAASAAGHGETQPATGVAESSQVDPAVAARLTADEVAATVAGGAALGDLLRAVAAHNQYPAVTREVLRAGAPIDGRDEHGWTALMYAAAFNRNAEVVHTLLDAGADLRAGGWYRPVPSAARHLSVLAPELDAPFVVLHSDMAELFHSVLMEIVADGLGGVELRGGEPALFLAAAYNEQPTVAQALIDSGSDVNASLKGGVTALMMAAAVNPNLEVVEVLLAAGADVNARTVTGENPLLVAAGYNGNEDGITALMMAAAVNPYPEIAESLLAAGADVNARTATGQTALMDAARNPFTPRTLRALLVAGAEVDAPDDQGGTALVHAVRSSGFDSAEKVTALIEAGADVHVRVGDDGATVLMHAARYNPEATWTLQELVDAGVELDARDNRGWTALMRSAAHGSDSDVVEALLGLGADVSLQNDAGQTALDLMRANPDLNRTHVYWRLQELASATTYHITAEEAADLTVTQAREAIAEAAPLGRLLCEVVCYNRNAAVTRTLLAAGAPTNYQCAYGWTALMRAAALNPNPSVVQALLDAGAELAAPQPYEPVPIGCNHPDSDSREAINLVSVLSEQYQNAALRGGEAAFLLAAAYNENPAVLQAFIDAGAEVNAYTSYDDGGVTPLILAAGLNRNPVVVRTLIAAGADPNAGLVPAYFDGAATGPTVLMAAAAYNPNPTVLQVLLEAGADVHGTTYDGWTALMAAAMDTESPAVVRKLLAAGAEVEARDQRGTTALMAATGNRWAGLILDMLLAAGAMLETRDDSGATALHAAVGNPLAMRVLLAAGAALEARDNTGRTPLMTAAGDSYGADVVPLLVAAGADLEARSDAGETALIAAGRGGNSKALEALIAAGADLEARDSGGRTALIAASEDYFGKYGVPVLLAAGAQLEARDDVGDTALIVAARGRRSEMLEALIAAGAELEARNHAGATALLAAVAGSVASRTLRSGLIQLPAAPFRGTSGWSDAEALTVVRALLAAGATPRVRDAQGATALMHAAGYGSNREVLELLAEAGHRSGYAGRRGLVGADVGSRVQLKSGCERGAARSRSRCIAGEPRRRDRVGSDSGQRGTAGHLGVPPAR